MRQVIELLACVALMLGAAGCPSDAAVDPPVVSDPAPGEPLQLNNIDPAQAGECAQCTQAAGDAHLCGKSRWCATCQADAVDTADAGGAHNIHVCNVSHFCKTCGYEAAIAGHRCGESLFDKASLSDVDREELDDDEDDEDDEE